MVSAGRAVKKLQPDGVSFARRGGATVFAKGWGPLAKVEVQPDCEVVLKWNQASVAATD